MSDKPASISQEQFVALKEALLLKGEFQVNIVSGSMEPVIRTGESVAAKALEFGRANLKRFDILVFWNGEHLICHYLWSRNQGVFAQKERLIVTRPLAGRGEDFPIRESWVVGWASDKRIPWFYRARILLREFLKPRRS